MEREVAWNHYSEEEKKKVFEFAEEYRKFISACKTERECVRTFVERAEAAGYLDIKKVIAEGIKLESGARVYADNNGKALAMFIVGKKPMEEGMRILGAHVDSPRMDLKQNPFYEDTGLAMLDTHYYGGVKKYQWVTLPLALHGVVAKKDGSVVEVNIGDKPGDPVFGVSDLLIHLAGEQMEKKAAKVIEGENLDLLIGSIPLAGEEKENAKDTVKENILGILKEEYGIEEEDFLSAEIEVVPAGEARDYGFDRSMIMGYGHDDRVCAYPSFEAMLAKNETPEYTSVCLLVDKEEIGSVGATGMQSRFFENMTAEVMERMGQYSELKLRRWTLPSRMKRSAGASILSLRTFRAPAWALSAKSRISAIRTPKRLPVSRQYRSGSRMGLPRASGRVGSFFIPPAPFSMRKTRMLRNDFFTIIRTLSARSSGSYCRRNMIRTAFSIAV